MAMSGRARQPWLAISNMSEKLPPQPYAQGLSFPRFAGHSHRCSSWPEAIAMWAADLMRSCMRRSMTQLCWILGLLQV